MPNVGNQNADQRVKIKLGKRKYSHKRAKQRSNKTTKKINKKIKKNNL